MHKVVMTATAKEDLFNSAKYIKNEIKNIIASKKLVDDAEKVLKSLENMPTRQPLVKDSYLASLGIRLVLVNNYLIFYTVDEKEKVVSVLRFLSSKRDWINLLK